MLKAIKNKLNDNGRIFSFDVVTLRTSGMRGAQEYEIVMKNGEAEVSFYRIRYTQDDDLRELEERAAVSEDEALKLLNDCRLLSWDGFCGKHPIGVKDGIMFTLSAVVNGGREIKASGSENFPKHYRDFTDRLYKILSGDKAKQ